MALLESIGIGSVLGSIGQAVLASRGDGRPSGFAQVFGPGGIIAQFQAAQVPTDVPPPTPDAPAPVDVVSGRILAPTIFAIQRAAVEEWMQDHIVTKSGAIGPFTQAEVQEILATDPDLALLRDRLVECMLITNSPPDTEAVADCFDLLEASPTGDPQDIFGAERGAFGGEPVFARLPGITTAPPGTAPGIPGTTAPGVGEPGVIRPRDVPSPTSPEIGPLPGEPGRRVPDVLMPVEFPEIEFEPPDLGEPLPPLVEIELIPVRLPDIPRRAPAPAVKPPSPAELEPFTKPLPNRLPPVPTRRAPAPVKIPPTAVPEILIGTAVGTGIGTILRGRVPGVRTPSGSIGEPPPVLPPQPPLVPDLVGQTQTQAQRLRTESERKRCEKTRRKNRKICWTGIYREKRSKTDFTKWYARDCFTGEFLEDTERKK